MLVPCASVNLWCFSRYFLKCISVIEPESMTFLNDKRLKYLFHPECVLLMSFVLTCLNNILVFLVIDSLTQIKLCVTHDLEKSRCSKKYCSVNIFLCHDLLIVHNDVYICFKRAITKNSFQDRMYIDINGAENLNKSSAE